MAFLRGQEAFPVLALEPRIAQDAIDGGEGYSTLIPAVSGLARSALKSHITKMNTPTRECSVVPSDCKRCKSRRSRWACPLYGLVTALGRFVHSAGQTRARFRTRSARLYSRCISLSSMDLSHRFPGNRHTCYRLWTRRTQWNGPLIARNFEGCGVRVIVLGEKCEDGAVLCDVRSVKYEDRRTKKWTAKLIRTRCVLILVSSARVSR